MNDNSHDDIAEIRNLLEHYTPGSRATVALEKCQLVLLVGISGAGKDTIKQRLLETGRYHDFVSHTTRQPRANKGIMEQDGIDYHFISLKEAARMLREGEYIEAKEYSANVYGTSITDLEIAGESSKVALNDIEVQGVDEYMQLSKKTIPIFLLPPSFEEWKRRWQQRYDGQAIDPEDSRLRTEAAITELTYALSKDYYYFLINNDVEHTVEEVDRLVETRQFASLEAESRQVAEKILKELQATA